MSLRPGLTILLFDYCGWGLILVKPLLNFECRSCKYLNNIVEQDHRFIKKRVGPMLGIKSFESGRRTLAGIEIVHMLKKTN